MSKEREDKLCDRELRRRQEIKLENKKTIEFNPRKHWKRKRTKSSLRKDRLKKDEDGIVFDRDTDGQTTIGRALTQELREQEGKLSRDGF